MTIEVCDLCKNKEPKYRFKVKMSRKGYYQHTGYGMSWVNLWNPYRRIYICDECGEKLFGIASDKTVRNKMINSLQQQPIQPMKD